MAFFQEKIPRVKDGAYVINFDHKNSKGTHWVSLFIGRKLAVYFDTFGIEYIPQEVLNKIRDISINIMNLLCVDFIVSLSQNTSCRKNFVRLY